ncbi:unnamed protein product [Musa banksii]
MREEVEVDEEPKCFARWDWEEQLPLPHELMPLSQALITPDLALAFGIPSSSSAPTTGADPAPDDLLRGPHSSDLNGGRGEEEPARTLKRPRLVWTPQLHKRFVDAVAHLGINNAVPKTIMQLMGVDGLTRENVASHLQKYRLYLKRMQMHGLNPSSPSSAPQPFLGRMPVAALQHHQQNTAPVQLQQQQQHQYYHQTHLGHFPGSGPGFLTRNMQPPPVTHRTMGLVPGMGSAPVSPHSTAAAYLNTSEWSGMGEGGARRKELTLFPTGED